MNSKNAKFDLDTFLTKLEKDPIVAAKAARTAAKKMEGGYQKRLHEMIAAAFALAMALKDDAAATKRLCQQPFFKKNRQYRPKIDTDREIQLLAVRYVFDADTKELRDRCAKYARALAAYMDGRTKPIDIPALIEKNHGIDKLASGNARSATSADEDVVLQEDADDLDGVSDDDDFARTPPTPNRAGRTRPAFEVNLENTMLLDGKRIQIDKALNSKTGDIVKFATRRGGKRADGLSAFQITKVQVIPKA